MKLPFILVLDDLLHWSQEDRQQFCRRLGLFDGTSGDLPDQSEEYIAIAEFRSGQVRNGREIANDLHTALQEIETRWHPDALHRWSMVLLDLQFDFGSVQDGPLNPDSNWPKKSDREYGLCILRAMISRWPDKQEPSGACQIPVVVLSSLGRERHSLQAGRAGALRYVEKEELTPKLMGELLDEMGLLEDPDGFLVGHSAALLRTLRRAREVGRSAQGNVLILGEMGSGKSSLATYIHRHSARRERQMYFYTVGQGMDPALLKAQLFGFWYGAYTPADKSEAGLTERAHGSTLFLDEIGNLPPESQTELLEFGRLQRDGTRRLTRLGSFPTSPASAVSQAKQSMLAPFHRETQTFFVDVFLITATNKPLDDPDYIRESHFLPDLFQRLGREYFDYLKFPPLFQRREDIIPLFMRFLEEATKLNRGVWPKALNAEVIERLLAYPWPGNVTELRGVAREVERSSRHWGEVQSRYLGNFDLPVSKAPVALATAAQSIHGFPAAPQVDLTKTDTAVANLDTALRTLSNVRVIGIRSELDGALERLTDAYSNVVVKLLDAALDLTQTPARNDGHDSNRTSGRKRKSDLLGELRPTAAMKLLLRRDLSASKAADEVKRIFGKLKSLPDPASRVGRVLTWARSGRSGRRAREFPGKDSKKNA